MKVQFIHSPARARSPYRPHAKRWASSLDMFGWEWYLWGRAQQEVLQQKDAKSCHFVIWQYADCSLLQGLEADMIAHPQGVPFPLGISRSTGDSVAASGRSIRAKDPACHV